VDEKHAVGYLRGALEIAEWDQMKTATINNKAH
jgi:hypothetical protein